MAPTASNELAVKSHETAGRRHNTTGPRVFTKINSDHFSPGSGSETNSIDLLRTAGGAVNFRLLVGGVADTLLRNRALNDAPRDLLTIFSSDIVNSNSVTLQFCFLVVEHCCFAINAWAY